jgi:DNA-binding IclR family transcriptional regulator
MKTKVLGKALEVLELVAWSDGPLSLKSLCRESGLSLATASRLSADLVEAGLMRKSGYRSFEPSLGLIHLGQRAMLNYVFPKKANRLLRARCKALGLKGGLAGIFKDRVVYLYNSAHDEAPDRLGMPFTGHPFNSNIALVVLGASRGKKAALRVLRESAGRHLKGIALKNSIESFKARLESLEREGHSFLDGGAYWNASVPLRWREQTLGLALYGSPDEAKEPARLIREVKRLRDDVEETLLNQS